ncbi:hypothetical protein PHET_11448 [Paragonimus heterotremus]|uniref:Mon2/Sec7/BIG1-like HUS domain-containing protein n=1 Tax=Paragonimus heterotremus TaxID=100268 RepID=A0A8J4T0W3_9TREM|nr:hypothetical protein PHET_11448 [Paragonimus heterotremus]
MRSPVKDLESSGVDCSVQEIHNQCHIHSHSTATATTSSSVTHQDSACLDSVNLKLPEESLQQADDPTMSSHMEPVKLNIDDADVRNENQSESSPSEFPTFSEASVSNTVPPQPQPYGLPAVHDLLHYLVSLLTPEHNSDAIITVSLGLVTIALETGADAIAHCPSLLQLIQSDLTKYLLLLLYSDRVWQFAATLRVCFMLFESMRKHLKLQMEVYLHRLMAICSPDNETTSYERREVALESVVRLFLVPGLATELYVNYDCDPYCSNLFEDITKMLAKNAYPVDRLMGTHLLSLDALLAVLNTIGTQCGSLEADAGVRQDCPKMALNSTSCQATMFIGEDSATAIKTQASSMDGVSHSRVRLNRHPVDTSLLPSREQLNTAIATKKVSTCFS